MTPTALGKTTQKKPGKGSFCVPLKAIDQLVAQGASAWQIGVYLTIAKHTEATGRFSTAGYKAIAKATGAAAGTQNSPGAGMRVVRELMALVPETAGDTSLGKLLYLPEEWEERTGTKVPETPNKLYPVNFVVNDFGSDEKIWFPNELVEGHGRFVQPLRRLKQCGDVAARALMHIYSNTSIEEYGGLVPYYFYHQYDEIGKKQTHRGFSIFTVEASSKTAKTFLIKKLLCDDTIPDKNDRKSRKDFTKPFWDALAALESNGFIYQVVTVMDGEPDEKDTRPIYELWVKGKVAASLKGEEGVADKINDFLVQRGWKSVADSIGRFHDQFYVITREGIPATVAGIYRVRFRVANPKNYGVTSGWQRIQADRDAFLADLELLSEAWPVPAPSDPFSDTF